MGAEGAADRVREHNELVPVEEIARLAGHASSRTTEVIYRRGLRPVITTGAEVMDQIFRPERVRGAASSAAGLFSSGELAPSTTAAGCYLVRRGCVI